MPFSLNRACALLAPNKQRICVELDSQLLYIINVYSPCSIQGKRRPWKELLQLKSNSELGDWCIAGDFNAVSRTSERKGSSEEGRSAERRDFKQFIEDMDVVDLPVSGKRFTWFSADGRSMSRLDRFLLTDGLVDKWKASGQWVGERDISDHCPIWLLCSFKNWGPKPFRSNNCWLEHKDFLRFVEHTWNNSNIKGRKAFILKEKLKLLRESL
ncbi:cysteine-rich receptor-like protein kinase [Trifolium pratense]|uniref:Cysteine-rich receptor-like protein kinase n=1 Tax=Trifolium pratense TaxID=57577 RepID=A0A2K3MBM6_TRIPR|nr:cysteine-rich receptor-like protein kinase [Trifolium pratense]